MDRGGRPDRAGGRGVSHHEHVPGDRRMPFGFSAGVQLKELGTKELQSTRKWCADKDDEAGTNKFKDLIDDIDQVLEDRLGLPLGLDEPDAARGRRGERRT